MLSHWLEPTQPGGLQQQGKDADTWTRK